MCGEWQDPVLCPDHLHHSGDGGELRIRVLRSDRTSQCLSVELWGDRMSSILASLIILAQAPPQRSMLDLAKTPYVCEFVDGIPTTLIRIAPGLAQPVITWRSTYFANSGYTPERRCQEVSWRLNQLFAPESIEPFIPKPFQPFGISTLNNQPTLCQTSDFSFDEQLCVNLVFTLEPSQDRMAVAERLVEFIGWESSIAVPTTTRTEDPAVPEVELRDMPFFEF